MKRDWRIYYGGEWVAAESGKVFEDFNPATGEVIATVPLGDRIDAQRAIAAASEAKGGWARMLPSKRASLLLRAAEILERKAGHFVDILIEEGGSTFGKAIFETQYSIELIKEAASQVHQVTGEILPSMTGKFSMVIRQPVGVVAVLSPWNFPLLLSLRAVAFALAVGDTVVLKPSSETPVSGGLMIAELFEEAGLPRGVLNCVTGPGGSVGDELVVNPETRVISFTGETPTGRGIGEKAGRHLKKVILELGGKNALIILNDADVDYAVDAATYGAFFHQGETCMSVERIIVEEPLGRQVAEGLVEKVKRLKVGDPRDHTTVIGPLINQTQVDKIHRQVTDALDKGGRLLTGGKYEGLYYYPTVLMDVTRHMAVYQEEIFGPVAPLIPVKDMEVAIEVANDSEFGLSAGIITKDLHKGLLIAERIQTGMVHINDQSVHEEPHAPFGGVKASGLGRHGGKLSIEEFTELKWVTLQRGHRTFPF